MATETYIPLATHTLSANTAVVTFSNLPSTYRDFVIVIDGDTTASCRPIMRFNNDTTANRHRAIVFGTGNYSSTNQSAKIDFIPGYAITGTFTLVVQVFDVNVTDKNTSLLYRVNQHDGNHTHMGAGAYQTTTAISEFAFDVTANKYASGTKFDLFGIEA